jgi:hypothetical protein
MPLSPKRKLRRDQLKALWQVVIDVSPVRCGLRLLSPDFFAREAVRYVHIADGGWAATRWA